MTFTYNLLLWRRKIYTYFKDKALGIISRPENEKEEYAKN
jgi:hypothetical protein